MKIYFSGIGGVGIGPLAEIAHDAGYEIVGSDREKSLMTKELEKRGIELSYDQSGAFLRSQHATKSIDWFVYTAALPEDHPELISARKLGLHTAKRDELIAEVIREKNLKLIAVAGTHGKTTTTGMLVWAMQQLGIPVSYSIGTTLSWAPSGHYDPNSQYFIYECDEFDRNFLHFEPFLSVITSLGYDHPDTYPTENSYREAFVKFIEQSDETILWEKDLRYLKQPDIAATYEAYDELMNLSYLNFAGDYMRHNAYLAEMAIAKISDQSKDKQLQVILSFPGTNRRFEKLSENIYTDYGHHPAEIAATLQKARELADHVVLIYQPHQNIRQHEIKDEYLPEIFQNADEIYWLPTYLSRENPELEILSPNVLSKNLGNNVHISDLNDGLKQNIIRHQHDGSLVLFMGAGSIDDWARDNFTK